WWHGAAWLLIVTDGLVVPAIGGPSLQFICIALALVCNGIGAWYAVAGRAADLVESRRRLRSLLIVLVAVNPDGAILSLPITAATKPTVSVQPASRPGIAPTVIERDEDGALLAALRHAMEHDRLYRAEGLSIGVLATKLGTPEHRLRRLINRQLGYRNFNAFLNGYRLADVTAALADPAQEAVPILTIALDAGFQSLGPCNRAFKAETGLTPSEFRRQKLAQTAQIAA